MRRLLPTSLSARLVATTVALVALVALLVSVATTLAMRAYLYDRLDSQVDQALGRATAPWRVGLAPLPTSSSANLGERERSEADGPEHEDGRFGQGAGTVTAVWDSYGARGELPTASGSREQLSSAALATLKQVPADGRSHDVELPGLGSYRVRAAESQLGEVVTGLPTRDIRGTLASLLGWEIVLAAGGVTVAALAGWVLVTRQLAPLRKVADTAHTVATLPLSTGEIGTTVRVPDDLTDPRTEVGQVGAALNTMLAHVEHALDERHRSEQQVRQFVADASHELRTPLATIQGYAELSRRAPPDAARLTHAMGKVEAEASRMSSLVEDLLLLARLDAGRPLEREEVDLTKMVLESVGDARIVAPDHRWVLELAEEPVLVTGDEQRLHQVITNLLGNARRHTPAGTTVTAGVHTSDDGKAAVVTVQDDGPGIPGDLQDSVFERFTRGDSSRTRESGGAGLGLSLVQAITDAHDGEIAVSSRPGSTTFTLTLPLDGHADLVS
ncbi:MAG TPA: HAMP domain-containing sensor histidine kinase [Nocardioidaceae bacterium]|nr:HAMP domain-containing sensor histidine kinase [Nocardioidaceae bacterium]